MPYRRARTKSLPHLDAARFAVGWHLAWAAVVVVAAVVLALLGVLRAGQDMAALAAGLAPALFGAAIIRQDDDTARRAALLVWAVGAVIAVLLTGGVQGAMSPWCLAPLAAAAAFRRADLLALGAAMSVGAAAIAGLGSALTPLPHPATAGTGMGLLALMTIAIGLAASLIAARSEAFGDGRAAGRDAQLRRLVDQQPHLLLSVGSTGRILACYGHPPAGLVLGEPGDLNIDQLAAPSRRADIDAALRMALAEGAAIVGFPPAHSPDGWCELELRRIEPTRLVGALRDARLQHDRETALDEARASAESQNAGKSRFLANMSHELRTPLNAIMGFSDIMRQRLFGPLSDRYTEYAELVHESGAHLLELINDVLDMSKIEAERFELAREDFDVREAVTAVLRLMRGQADRAGVQLRGVLPPDVLDVDADRRAVKQITLNLLSNALKFTPKGGSITLTVQAVGDMLEIVVADTGVGIAPDDLERLGRPFEQAGDASQKQGGTGLGLSLVRAFARLHGGDMHLESVLGEGATVTVRMPVVIPDTPADLNAANQA